MHRVREISVVAPLAALVLLGGCSSSPAPSRPAPPTPIARLNSFAVAVPRIDFCNLVPKVAVDDAVGSTHWKAFGYGNGDRADVTGDGADVVAEHGCVWRSSRSGAEARAWVFAQPVSNRFARFVVRRERGAPGCHLERGPVFGDPTLTQRCDRGSLVRVRHAGLFGDSWLSCEASDIAKPAVVRKRADAWCVEIANALNTNR